LKIRQTLRQTTAISKHCTQHFLRAAAARSEGELSQGLSCRTFGRGAGKGISLEAFAKLYSVSVYLLITLTAHRIKRVITS
jgi:hypothetical protein